MTLFSYRAINEDSKEVQGTIEAADLASATAALTAQHLEPIEVNEAMRLRTPVPAAATDQPLLKTAYAFEGTAKDGSQRKGTIQAGTKRQAFDRLTHDQDLTVTMLTPLGVPPARPDADLQQWQSPAGTAAPVATQASGWTAVEEKKVPMAAVALPKQQAPQLSVKQASSDYYPLVSTLRLYAGWLLAWYALVIAAGYYYSVRDISIDIPVVQSFVSSPLVISFMLAIFLFLVCSTVHRMMRGGLITGLLSAIVGVGGFVSLRMMLV